MLKLFLTLAVSAACGLLFLKCKVPGGMMVGALVGTTVLQISFNSAHMPVEARVAAQITAGAFIACSIDRRDVKRLKYVWKPSCLLIGCLLVLCFVSGFAIQKLCGLDWATSFFCAVPGGMSDTPIIAAEMGANGGKVAVAQFCRLVLGIGILPGVILFISKNKKENESEEHPTQAIRVASAKKPLSEAALTLATGTFFGIIGRKLGVPVGAMLFSLLSVLVLKLCFNMGYLPLWLKRIAQVLSGAYIGCSMTMQDVLEIKQMLPGILLLLLLYTANCIASGFLLHLVCKMPLKDAMLAATPAGATDMALIASDIGVHSADVIVISVIRMLAAIIVFPQLIRLLLPLLPI